MFLKNKNIIFKIRRSKVTDYAALRKAFARFRCSSHKFNIELGRHRGIARADRVCLYCFNNHKFLVVEDEYHVFFKCEKFDVVSIW